MSEDSDRLRASLRTILEEMLPELLAYAHWEYRVQSVSGSVPGPIKITAKATDPRVPDAVSIVLRPGPSGGVAIPIVGSSVLIGFANGDYAKAYVFSLDPNAQPSEVGLGDANSRVIRNGDTVAITGVQAGAGVTLAVISTDTSVIIPGPPPNGFSKVKA